MPHEPPRVRVCLVTTGQPSTNPRLVKEADALTDEGYDVHVLGSYCANWAVGFDADLLATRAWRFTWIDWRASSSRVLFWKSRIRHRAANLAVRWAGLERIAWRPALTWTTPELARAAVRIPADLYIAHNLGALPAAIEGASRRGVPVGFDAEDFHSGELPASDSVRRRLVESVERRLLPRCTYVTAASPMVADAYARLADVARPTTVLNVFPLRERPASFRAPDPAAPVRLYWFSQTIGPDRGLEDAVRAMGHLQEWPLELHLRGAWQPGYRGRLMQLADEAGVPRERIVAAVPAAPGEMTALAARCDIGLALEQRVSFNRDIALTNKIFVYLLAGLAVAATATRAQAALVPELDGAARMYQPGDAEGLAHVLRGWLERRETLVEARQTSWRLGEARYNWDLEKQTFLATVRGALRERRTADERARAGVR